MADTNFLVFNEANEPARTYNDSEYQNATQRQTGVIPGMAISRMHNKMFFQWSSMVKAVADFIVSKGYDAMDNDIAGMTAALQDIISAASSDLGYLLRQNSTRYEVGDIAFSPSLPSNLVLKCTTEGTTAATEPDFSGATIGGTVSDGEAVWTYMPLGTLSREIVPAFNHRDVIATSGTYTAPVTGWYRIVVKGGGGGGQGGAAISGQDSSNGGAGGGEGGTTIAFEKMAAGNAATVVIGAGGAGGAAGGSVGSAGGNTSVTINGNTYTGGGGGAGAYAGGAGGSGTIIGGAGGSRSAAGTGARAEGASGGGAGGAITYYGGAPLAAKNGGGGAGGSAISNSSSYAGGAGGNGFVWFEYFEEV